MADDLFKIHQLIQNSLTDGEFNNLVYYHFPAVYSQFTDGQTQDARIRLLIDYASKRQEINKLLEKIGEINPQAVTNLVVSSPSIRQLMNDFNDNETYLMYIDFKEGLQIFEETLKIFKDEQAQNKNRVNFALFFLEDSFNKKGDLCLQRLQYELKSKIHSPDREIFRPCPVRYTSGDPNNVVQEIAKFFKVKNFAEIFDTQKTPFEKYVNLVIEKIAQSLITNSVLFIEIFCDINHESDIDSFIPGFIETFWNPLTEKIENIIQDYDGIKIIAVVNSDWNLKERLSTNKLVPYVNINTNVLSRNKLTTIPLTNWTEGDISNWLRDYKPRLTESKRNEIASKIYNITGGTPESICQALKKYEIL